jgi:hypothetical protein
MHDVEEELTLDLKSDRGRVQSAILLYLLIAIGLNFYVWTRFVVLHRHGIHAFPLGERVERFGDLIRFTGKEQLWGDRRMVDYEHLRGTLFPKNYPALSVVVYLFLLQVCAPYAAQVFVAGFLGAMGVACTLLWLRVRRLAGYAWYVGAAIFLTGFFGWGTEMVLIRRNIEGLLWVFVCLGAALYARRRYRGSAVAFGIACCFKPVPILWFGLMARHRRYKELLVGLMTYGVVTLAALLVIDRNPVRAYRKTQAPSGFYGGYIAAFRRLNEIWQDHSLFQSVKTLSRVVSHRSFHLPAYEFSVNRLNDPYAGRLYVGYMVVAAVGGLLLLWKLWDSPVLNQIFGVTCASMVMPAVSGDYTLTMVLIPMGFLLIFLLQDVATGKVSLSLGKMLWFVLPCAWIVGSEPQMLLHGVLKCVALLVLLGASIIVPLPSTVFGEVLAPDIA